ncbi:MAG TPA: THUMP domain-containing protein [Cytophagales bacterium]|nr:THUMP domain-containing protein [Cytophagales bacterium]
MAKAVQQDFKMVAKTIFGLEDLLVDELEKLGAKDIEKHNRAVSFTGDLGFMYKANLCLRTALRVLKPIKSFQVLNETQLYNEIKKTDWSEYLGPKDTLAIDCVLSSDLFNHSQYLSQKAKDAIVDQFREKFGERPSVDLDLPTVRINLHISKETCTVSLDSSGESLHKRGYRDKTNLAPINEVLAAGLVLLSGWDKISPFVDPMCGSATILIEAALIACNIPPGYFKEEFGFQRWKDYDEGLWDLIYKSTMKKIEDSPVELVGVEISRNVAKKAKENIKLARVDHLITIHNSAFQDFEPPVGPGTLVMNPPYGERMHLDEDINGLYKSIGDTLKKKYGGYKAWIISSNMEAFKHVGLRPTRKIPVFNGQLECRFMCYNMYQGTKKIHKLKDTGSEL